jgi:UDP-N-acetylmuramoylalanine--D-glutamate ligase
MNAIVGGKVVILGGSEKKSDFSALVDRIKKGTDIEAVILLGESGLRIKDMLVSVGYTGKVFEGLGSMKEVVDLSSKIAEQGQAVLLSPGAASFGMFKNYKDRGDQFKKNVMGLRA